jgi:hypothetical protein
MDLRRIKKEKTSLENRPGLAWRRRRPLFWVYISGLPIFRGSRAVLRSCWSEAELLAPATHRWLAYQSRQHPVCSDGPRKTSPRTLHPLAFRRASSRPDPSPATPVPPLDSRADHSLARNSLAPRNLSARHCLARFAAPGERGDHCSGGLGTSRSESKKSERVPGEKLRRIRSDPWALKWLPMAP